MRSLIFLLLFSSQAFSQIITYQFLGQVTDSTISGFNVDDEISGEYSIDVNSALEIEYQTFFLRDGTSNIVITSNQTGATRTNSEKGYLYLKTRCLNGPYASFYEYGFLLGGNRMGGDPSSEQGYCNVASHIAGRAGIRLFGAFDNFSSSSPMQDIDLSLFSGIPYNCVGDVCVLNEFIWNFGDEGNGNLEELKVLISNITLTSNLPRQSKNVPAMGGIGLLALGLSILGLGAVRLRKI